jgi:hypothetical protein
MKIAIVKIDEGEIDGVLLRVIAVKKNVCGQSLNLFSVVESVKRVFSVD